MVKNLSCVSCADWNIFPINSLVILTSFQWWHLMNKQIILSFSCKLSKCIYFKGRGSKARSETTPPFRNWSHIPSVAAHLFETVRLLEETRIFACATFFCPLTFSQRWPPRLTSHLVVAPNLRTYSSALVLATSSCLWEVEKISGTLN